MDDDSIRYDDYDVSPNARVCKVYSKDDKFTTFVQLLLAFIALFSLYVKRQQERPRRRLRTWLLDVSKSGIGACYLHVLNMIVAAVLANLVRSRLDDQCAWYAINFTVDATVGLALSVVLMRVLDNVANREGWVELKDSGVYDDNEGLRHWLFQLTAWLVVLSVARLIEFLFMLVTSDQLARIGQQVFAPFQGNIRFELLFVMILFPGFCNVVYFWVVDSVLQADKSSAVSYEEVGRHNEYDDAGKARDLENGAQTMSFTEKTPLKNFAEETQAVCGERRD